MKVRGPDSKYVMQWQGAWRPVIYLFDYNNNRTSLTTRAAKAVLYVDAQFIGCLVTPGDLVERTDRDPEIRHWDYVKD